MSYADWLAEGKPERERAEAKAREAAARAPSRGAEEAFLESRPAPSWAA